MPPLPRPRILLLSRCTLAAASALYFLTGCGSPVHVAQIATAPAYEDGMVRISLDSAIARPRRLEFRLSVTVVSETKIVRPITHKVWGYDYGSNVGGREPDGIEVRDSFGNSLGLGSISPSFLGSDTEAGLYPRTTKIFTVDTAGLPVAGANSIIVGVAQGVFGNQKSFKLSIPWPNKAPEPTTGTVTPRAEPRVAPAPVVAHL